MFNNFPTGNNFNVPMSSECSDFFTQPQFAVPTESNRLRLIVTTLNGKELKPVMLCEDTVLSLKQRLCHMDGIPADQQRLVFAGRELQDSSTLINCGLSHWSKILRVIRWPSQIKRRRSKVESKHQSNAPRSCSEELKTKLLIRLAGRTDVTAETIPENVDGNCDNTVLYPSSPRAFSELSEWASSLASGGNTPITPSTAVDSAADDMSTSSLDSEGDAQVGPARHNRRCSKQDKVYRRMMKNRASAERSRQRKQAYVEELELRLSCTTTENEVLNARLLEMEKEIHQLQTELQARGESNLYSASASASTPTLMMQSIAQANTPTLGSNGSTFNPFHGLVVPSPMACNSARCDQMLYSPYPMLFSPAFLPSSSTQNG